MGGEGAFQTPPHSEELLLGEGESLVLMIWLLAGFLCLSELSHTYALMDMRT